MFQTQEQHLTRSVSNLVLATYKCNLTNIYSHIWHMSIDRYCWSDKCMYMLRYDHMFQGGMAWPPLAHKLFIPHLIPWVVQMLCNSSNGERCLFVSPPQSYLLNLSQRLLLMFLGMTFKDSGTHRGQVVTETVQTVLLCCYLKGIPHLVILSRLCSAPVLNPQQFNTSGFRRLLVLSQWHVTQLLGYVLCWTLFSVAHHSQSSAGTEK